jgi:hypothetical protein
MARLLYFFSTKGSNSIVNEATSVVYPHHFSDRFHQDAMMMSAS